MIDVSKYKDCWMTLRSGKRFHIFDPKPEEIIIEDILYPLAFNCRFNGHCKRFYSVAEHSIFVSSMVSEKAKLYALLHDAAEAYLVDIPRPLKIALNDFTDGLIHQIEHNILHTINKAFGLDDITDDIKREVKLADNTALYIEANHFFKKEEIKDWTFGEILDPIPDVKIGTVVLEPLNIAVIFANKIKEELVKMGR